MWNGLGYRDDLRRSLFRSFQKGELSYEQWCAKCAFYFRQRQLDRSLFSRLANSIHPTAHLYEGLEMLKAKGFTLGIISGGISTLLGEVIPDYRDWFDFVHINAFQFDGTGRLLEITPTPYDFEGKLACLEEESSLRGLDLRSCVFVGEGANDGHVVASMARKGVGLTVAYPPSSTAVEIWADECVVEDDLRVVAEVILERG